jgi:hypothetical protein
MLVYPSSVTYGAGGAGLRFRTKRKGHENNPINDATDMNTFRHDCKGWCRSRLT